MKKIALLKPVNCGCDYDSFFIFRNEFARRSAARRENADTDQHGIRGSCFSNAEHG
jgi:hypothetical protein